MRFLKKHLRPARCTPVELRRFIEAFARLDMIEFLGVVRILNISLVKEEKDDPKDNVMKQADELMEEVIDKFIEMDWYKRTNLYMIVKRALEQKEEEKKEVKANA